MVDMPWCIAAGCSFSMCTRTEAGFAFEGSHVYSPESLAIAFWTSSRLEVSTPFSVTSEMPPRGESKFMSSRLCFQTTAGGGSGAYLTVQVRFIVEPLLINKSGPPLISVTGSTTVR
uniref:(northern house mosquito) hypothetical protein n=2 Tax=Culex pipiens TaxID=7175 RepID=A0A8D8JE03_CULPI